MRQLPHLLPPLPIWLGVCIAVLGAACGGDDKPADDGFIDVPGDVATFEEALLGASDGDRIRVDTDTLRLAQRIEVADLVGIEIVGRENSAQVRPVLLAESGVGTVIEIEPSATGCLVRGLEILGTFATGVRMRAPGSVVEDCRIEGGQYSVYCSDGIEGARIEGNLLLRPVRFGVYCTGGADPEVVGNSIIESADCGIYTSASDPTCENNLIVRSVNWGVFCFSTPEPVLACNGIFGSGEAPYSGCEPGEGDILMDPEFCDEVTYALDAESIYVTGPCGRIGAVGACE